MQNIKLILSGKLIAIAIILLGIFHNLATITPIIKGELSCPIFEDNYQIIYLRLIFGASFILCGILILSMINKIIQHDFLTFLILIISTFLAISGLLSVLFMFSNSLAWIALVLNMTMFTIATLLHHEINLNDFN